MAASSHHHCASCLNPPDIDIDVREVYPRYRDLLPRQAVININVWPRGPIPLCRRCLLLLQQDDLVASGVAVSKPFILDMSPSDSHDPVSHPSHYTFGRLEVIEVIEDWGWGLAFCLGNAVKYIARAGKKDPAKLREDLEKARWYLDRAIQSVSKKDG